MSARRRETDFRKWPRTDRINERYYAQDNQPSFNQLKREQCHFVDAQGRQYTLAVANGQVFQNHRLLYPSARANQDSQHPAQDSRGAITLWVKLGRASEWFGGQSEVGHPLMLKERRTGREHVVELTGAFKHSPRRRTGTVTVQGLSLEQCVTLLNG